MILADNGSNWYISGAPDPRWNDDELSTLKAIKGSSFEVGAVNPLFEARALGLVGEAAPARGGARAGGAARARRGRGAEDQGDQPIERVGPVALLRAVALRGDDEDAVLRQPVAGEPLECGCFGEIIASQLGLKTALRNLLLLIPALIVFFGVRSRSSPQKSTKSTKEMPA